MYSKFFIFFITGLLTLSGCKSKTSNPDQSQNDTTIGHYKSSGSFLSAEFYFVGVAAGNPGIFKFTAENKIAGKQIKEVSKFWFKRKEKVLKLSYSPDKKCLFFITAEDYGKKGVLPYVNGIKLYRINPDSSKVKFIKRIGNAVQVFTIWGQDNNFRIMLNTFDRNSADFVNQQTFIFNAAGKIENVSSKRFNILKDGYPQILEKTGLTTSPGSRYSVFSIDSSQTFIYLQSNSDGKAELITSTEQKFNQADWSPDEKYLLFSTVNAKPNDKTDSRKGSKLYIYSLDKRKIIKIMDAGSLKNFLIMGDLLILDKGFQKNSFIEMINYRSLKPFYTIHIPEGCGLKSIM